ncbi:hypothetical protein P0136_05750 [Lentisphaerota bacterium ZTH]|nr:hypothetical protein JYG24_03135 [Lentisphaerota bacterium]WET07495.1 hypothetical protein P0136_05750 [Lentisphaerota bacterium ZTH]
MHSILIISSLAVIAVFIVTFLTYIKLLGIKKSNLKDNDSQKKCLYFRECSICEYSLYSIGGLIVITALTVLSFYTFFEGEETLLDDLKPKSQEVIKLTKISQDIYNEKLKKLFLSMLGIIVFVAVGVPTLCYYISNNLLKKYLDEIRLEVLNDVKKLAKKGPEEEVKQGSMHSMLEAKAHKVLKEKIDKKG